MPQTTIEKLNSMDDFQILRFFNHLNNSLSQQLKGDVNKVLQNVPDQVMQSTEMQQLMKAQDEFAAQLDQKDAAAFARQSLTLMANNPDTAQALAESLDNDKDNEMAVGAILALGGAVSFILLLATSKLTYKKGDGWELNVGGNREHIKEVTTLVKTLFNVIPDSAMKLIKGK